MPPSGTGNGPAANEDTLEDDTSVSRSIAGLRLDPDTPARDAVIDRGLEKVQHERISLDEFVAFCSAHGLGPRHMIAAACRPDAAQLGVS